MNGGHPGELQRFFEGLNFIGGLGGGYCTVLKLIMYKYPPIKAINFGLAAVLQNTPFYPDNLIHRIPSVLAQ